MKMTRLCCGIDGVTEDQQAVNCSIKLDTADTEQFTNDISQDRSNQTK